MLLSCSTHTWNLWPFVISNIVHLDIVKCWTILWHLASRHEDVIVCVVCQLSINSEYAWLRFDCLYMLSFLDIKVEAKELLGLWYFLIFNDVKSSLYLNHITLKEVKVWILYTSDLSVLFQFIDFIDLFTVLSRVPHEIKVHWFDHWLHLDPAYSSIVEEFVQILKL